VIVTDRLRSYRAAMKVIGNVAQKWVINKRGKSASLAKDGS